MTILQTIRYTIATAIYSLSKAVAPKDAQSNVVGPWPPSK